MISYLESIKAMPLVGLHVRTAIIETQSATPTARLLVSPGSGLTDAQLASAGAITDIVANGLLHSAGVKRAAAAHPKATLWGPPGIREKHPELQWKIFGEDAWPYDADVAWQLIEGMPKIREIVLVDRASKTLYVADLAFNILDAKGFGARVIFGLFGTYRRFAISKFFLGKVADRAAFLASMQQLMKLDWDALAPGHGSVVESDAKAKFKAALAERGFSV